MKIIAQVLVMLGLLMIFGSCNQKSSKKVHLLDDAAIDKILNSNGVITAIHNRYDGVIPPPDISWSIENEDVNFIYVQVGINGSDRFEIFDRYRIDQKNSEVDKYDAANDAWLPISR